MQRLVVLACLGLAGCERSGGSGAGSGSSADHLITYDPVELRKVLQDLAGGHVFVLKRNGPFAEYRDVVKTARSIDRDVLAPDGRDVPPSWMYYVTTDDLDSALTRAKNSGARVLNGPMDVPGGQRIVQLMDPQGAAFALVTPPKS